jgi:hypothetical protein
MCALSFERALKLMSRGIGCATAQRNPGLEMSLNGAMEQLTCRIGLVIISRGWTFLRSRAERSRPGNEGFLQQSLAHHE